MQVTVKPYLFLRETLGSKYMTVELPEDSTVKELLRFLCREYGIPESLTIGGATLTLLGRHNKTDLIILVNGFNIRQLHGLYSILQEGDRVSIFPPAAGG